MTKSLTVDVVGVGLNATDTLIPLPCYPALGSKVEFHSANVLPGGQVASAMVACQQWGLRTRYVGKMGDDPAAMIHRAEFDRLGVEAQLLTAPGCASQQAFILVDDAGERTVLWKRDHRLTLRPEELRREWIVDSRALHVDGHDTAAAVVAADWAREAGIPVIADLDELYAGRRPWWHPDCGEHRKADSHRGSACACVRLLEIRSGRVFDEVADDSRTRRPSEAEAAFLPAGRHG